MGIYYYALNEFARINYDGAEKHLIHLMSHLLKFEYQPERQGVSWINTIKEGFNVVNLNITNTNIKNKLYNNIDKIYIKAKKEAENETGHKITFPNYTPYNLDDILNKDYLENLLIKLSRDDKIKQTIIMGFNK